MSDNFDIGPLTWVKDDIDQSLDSVLDSLDKLKENLDDTSVMRFAKTHIYQASGALDMVGLEGCRVFCTQLEALAGKLETQALNANEDVIEKFSKAVKTLKYYIQELLNGSSDIPLRLYPVLQPIVEIMGEKIEESELFFPDTSNTAPKTVESQEFGDDDYAPYISQQRLAYQKAFILWFKTKDADALSEMHQALSNVTKAQHKSSIKTLWWVASAFIETLSLEIVANNLSAKKICRKLDQELRLLSEGQSKPNHNLLRDMLYFVAISDIDKDIVAEVKTIFELKDKIDQHDAVQAAHPLSGEAELESIEEIKSILDELREIWEEVSSSIDLDKLDAQEDQALVELDNVLSTRFTEKLGSIQDKTAALSQPVVSGLFKALLDTSVVLRDDKSKATQSGLIEVATALHLLDSALGRYQNIDVDTVQHLSSEIERLNDVASGIYEDKPEDRNVGGLDRDTVEAVIKDIHASLKVVEQALDTYFRNPEDKSTLNLTTEPLKQVAAIFDMLNKQVPTQVVKASTAFIQHFQADDYTSNQDHFELVAESLSMVGLYAEEMPNVRAESEHALTGAVERLNTTLAGLGIDVVEQVQETEETNTTIAVGAEPTSSAELHEAEVHETITDRALDDELLDIYLTEAEEVLAHIAQNLQALRVNPTDADPMVETRRSYHTLKGSGRTVGLVGQAEVAWKVESFLNDIIDKKEILSPAQIARLEEITAVFAEWAAGLRANNVIEINQDYWIKQAEGLPNPIAEVTTEEAMNEEVAVKEAENEIEVVEEVVNLAAEEVVPVDEVIEEEKPTLVKEKKQDAYVLISGKRKLSRQLYDIFLSESMQNLSILEQDVAKLEGKTTVSPQAAVKRAVHTLASNALAAGFKSMGELCRALEDWMDEAFDSWQAEYLTLYSNTTQEIAKMWQAVSEKRTPRAKKALIKLLNEASEKMKQDKEHTDVIDQVLYDAASEPAVTQEDDETLSVATVEADETKFPAEAISTKTSSLSRGEHVNPELLEMFIEEANEILPQIGQDLRAWKGKPSKKAHSDALQRSLHTLKGSARMAAQGDIGDIAHEFEEYIIGLGKQKPQDGDFDTMFIQLDKMAAFFDDEQAAPVIPVAPVESTLTIDEDDEVHIARAADRQSQFLRLRAEVLDRLISEAGEVSIIRSRIDREMVGFKHSSNDLTDSLVRLRGYLRELEIEAETQMQSRMNILQEASESFDPLEFDRFTRLQELTRMIAESVNDVSTIQGGLMTNLDNTEAALQQQNRMNRDLQQGLLGVRMLPFKQISERMQRIVRQTARELNKSVDLVIEGEATEIDRGVLDRISAPLEHLLRNAIAHGVESKAQRKTLGKPESGTIKIKLQTINDEIQMVVTDDGAGVDLAKVKQKAISKQLLDEQMEITEDTLLSVIFEPGFSTSDEVSQIAGRGVGLDVVRNDISSLGGRIDMASETGKGSTFNIFLPITQSVSQVLMVRSGEDLYALPVAMIEQAQKIKRDNLVDKYADGKVVWSDADYPLHHLAKLLDHQEHQLEDTPYASVLLLRSGAHTVALHVDEVIGNHEVVMKAIGPELSRVPGIVGATVTGDGQIVLIINPVQMANREVLSVGSISVKNVKTKKATKKMRALVVDDSLTMRKVLGRLLEREGYEVQVAKDGMDAIELLQYSTPDIILTDIEMPRMDGFGLARNIRDDQRTKETPLIMISSRTADKHQNLAKEIGVDAFFGKPVQDEELTAKMKELLHS